MKKYITRKKRFKEYTNLKEFTGLILVSSFLPKVKNSSKPIKINITNLHYYKNDFCLLDHFVSETDILNFSKQYFNLSNEILSITNIYSKKNKVIYLLYLKYNTKILNYTEFTTINLYKYIEYEQSFNKDLYQAIYNNYKNIDIGKIKLVYNKKNYIETNISNIFYYLIGNEYVKSK